LQERSSACEKVNVAKPQWCYWQTTERKGVE
jgi:hypothetical protein